MQTDGGLYRATNILSMYKRKKQRTRRTEYEVEIPGRETILRFLTEENRPRSLKHIAKGLAVEDPVAITALESRLNAMQRDGQIIKNRREGYGLVEKMDLIRGRVIGHPDGYGFLKLEDGGEDLFLSAREMRRLLHGDTVLAHLTGVDRRGRRQGSVVEVLERGNQQVVGRYYRERHVGFVAPDNKRINQDILIPETEAGKARSGDYVVAEIVTQPDVHNQPVGRIREILGRQMSADLAVAITLKSYEIPSEWPKEIKQQIKKYSTEIADADKAGREDLRDLPLVTIDGEDARDFDDAVYCEPQGNGWRLLVAIADVSHYVQPSSALDKEARERGNSVYFPQQVIPMLPEVLSNGLCSLNPDVDRLCLVCELHINKQGRVKRSRFFDGVMRSAARLTYTEVAAMVVNEDRELRKRYKDTVAALDNLYALFRLMHSHRQSNAVLDFRTTEAKISFNKRGIIQNISAYERNDAHRLIEEFMLAANVAAAGFLLEKEIPAIYRIHETPKEEKLNDLREFLAEFGLMLGGSEEPTAKDYAVFLEKIELRDDRHLIETVLLRSLPLAVYSADNAGHFGLGFPAYTHFTSPIRRYPDLLVHRAIRHLLKKGSAGGFRYGHEDMQVYATHCSMTERRADESTREIVQWYKCQYMQDRVGDEFHGTISSVTSFGVFVELDDIFVEGLVHITSLPNDYYHFDPIGHRLRGERTGYVYRLGNRVRVKVVRVDLDDKKIDFEMNNNQ